MKLDPAKKRIVTDSVFAAMILLALLNTARFHLLVGFWGVVNSVVCPLIVTVLPGSFFYYVLKENEVQHGYMKANGALYAIFGLIVLPILLTLSTKNLFATTNA